MMIFIVTLVFLYFVIPDIISMFKEKDYGVIVLYLSIIAITYTLSILIAIDVKIPSPQPIIKNVITMVIGESTTE